MEGPSAKLTAGAMPQTNRFDAGPVDIFYPLVKLASKNLTKKVVLVNTNNVI